MPVSRRTFLSLTSTLPLASTLTGDAQTAPPRAVPASFPSHDPDLAREMVAVSHGNVARVRELLELRQEEAGLTYHLYTGQDGLGVAVLPPGPWNFFVNNRIND